MTALTVEQMHYVKTQVDLSQRYYFVTALPTDRDRKLAVITVWENDGEIHTAIAKTDKAPNWLTNEEQFHEVVADAIRKLNRGF
jgi:hypothetical protein